MIAAHQSQRLHLISLFPQGQVLRKIVAPVATIDPSGYRITRWGTDPFALGSYSYVSVGCSAGSCQKCTRLFPKKNLIMTLADDMDALAVPLDTKKVYFAGEATNSEHPSTVHGMHELVFQAFIMLLFNSLSCRCFHEWP